MNNEIEGNKLIAEFDGWEFEVVEDGDVIVSSSSRCGRFSNNKFIEFLKTDLQYHSSWDWLMPVYKKCYDMFIDSHKNYKECADIFEDILSALWHCNIETTHLLIVEYIQLNNKEQKAQVSEIKKHNDAI